MIGSERARFPRAVGMLTFKEVKKMKQAVQQLQEEVSKSEAAKTDAINEVATLKQTVKDLEGQVHEQKLQSDSSQAEASQLATALSAAKHELSNKQSHVLQLQDRVKDLHGKVHVTVALLSNAEAALASARNDLMLANKEVIKYAESEQQARASLAALHDQMETVSAAHLQAMQDAEKVKHHLQQELAAEKASRQAAEKVVEGLNDLRQAERQAAAAELKAVRARLAALKVDMETASATHLNAIINAISKKQQLQQELVAEKASRAAADSKVEGMKINYQALQEELARLQAEVAELKAVGATSATSSSMSSSAVNSTTNSPACDNSPHLSPRGQSQEADAAGGSCEQQSGGTKQQCGSSEQQSGSSSEQQSGSSSEQQSGSSNVQQQHSSNVQQSGSSNVQQSGSSNVQQSGSSNVQQSGSSNVQQHSSNVQQHSSNVQQHGSNVQQHSSNVQQHSNSTAGSALNTTSHTPPPSSPSGVPGAPAEGITVAALRDNEAVKTVTTDSRPQQGVNNSTHSSQTKKKNATCVCGMVFCDVCLQRAADRAALSQVDDDLYGMDGWKGSAFGDNSRTAPSSLRSHHPGLPQFSIDLERSRAITEFLKEDWKYGQQVALAEALRTAGLTHVQTPLFCSTEAYLKHVSGTQPNLTQASRDTLVHAAGSIAEPWLGAVGAEAVQQQLSGLLEAPGAEEYWGKDALINSIAVVALGGPVVAFEEMKEVLDVVDGELKAMKDCITFDELERGRVVLYDGMQCLGEQLKGMMA